MHLLRHVCDTRLQDFDFLSYLLHLDVLPLLDRIIVHSRL
jgi:hypothetical protein